MAMTPDDHTRALAATQPLFAGMRPADDPTTLGIVSVWADRDGQAMIWRRVGGRVLREQARFRPWLLAAHRDDLAHLAVPEADEAAPISYTALAGPPRPLGPRPGGRPAGGRPPPPRPPG
jgi:hypothetical protein